MSPTFTIPNRLHHMTIRHILLPCSLVVVLFVGCRKEDPITQPPPAPPDPPPTFELDLNGPQGMQLTAGDTTYTYVDGDAYSAVYQVGGTTGTPSTRYYIAGLAGGDEGDLVAAIRIGTVTYEGVQVDIDDFYTLLATGAKIVAPATTGGQGVEIEFLDADAQLWSTRCGSTAQPGSGFTITEMEPGYDGVGAFARIVAVFNCTVYNCSTGASMALTNGGAVLEFREF